MDDRTRDHLLDLGAQSVMRIAWRNMGPEAWQHLRATGVVNVPLRLPPPTMPFTGTASSKSNESYITFRLFHDSRGRGVKAEFAGYTWETYYGA